MPAVLCMHSDKLRIGAVLNNFGCSPYFSTLFFEQYMDVIYKKTEKRQIMIQKTANWCAFGRNCPACYTVVNKRRRCLI